MIITIDGPAASGKSSVARALAQRLKIFYLYTGLLYRAVAYLLAEKYSDHVSQGSCSGPFKIDASDLSLIQKITYIYEQGQPQLFFEGKNITHFLNTPEIDQLSSLVGACKSVRDALLPVQHVIAQKYEIIADGRDCGSVVFTRADYKFYLTASLSVRAQRRFLDLKRRGEVADLEKVKIDLEERDHRDMNREIAPLKIPENGLVIDNSTMSFEETVEAFLRVIKK